VFAADPESLKNFRLELLVPPHQAHRVNRYS
jgi:hypothetical protein